MDVCLDEKMSGKEVGVRSRGLGKKEGQYLCQILFKTSLAWPGNPHFSSTLM